jgi:adenosylcobinamide-phosphate synthase
MLIDLSAWAGTAADPFLIVLLALAIDAAVGDPQWLYRAVPHPVALLGRLIAWGEARLNDARDDVHGRFRAGLALTAAITLSAAAVGWLLSALLREVAVGWLIEAALASSLLAGRSLHGHVLAVERGLAQDLEQGGLEAGRAAVSEIVGRDPESLDEPGVRRAAVESLAENSSDGLVAPVFWYAVAGLFGLGLAGLCAYKAVNTLDSMIGHRSVRFAAFGRAAARLDDWVNWAPARLAGALIAAAAFALPGADGRRAWRTMLRDARLHRSPNAGWQEAAFAGALDLALAGPRRYRDEVVEDAWMGDGRRSLTQDDLRAALKLYLVAWALLALLLVALCGLSLVNNL